MRSPNNGRKCHQFEFDKDTLNKLKNEANSCVEVKHCEHHLALHPYHLKNISQSIKDILKYGIAKYNKDLHGILLGFDSPKVLGDTLPMYDDACFMHVDIEADFYVFRPEIGSILHGIVNKKSQDHVGCLVHQIFNVAIPKPNSDEDWVGHKAQIGNEIQLKIIQLNLDARLPYIQAELLSITSEDSGFSTSEEATSPKKKNKVKKFGSDDEEAESESPKKKSKHKKVDKEQQDESESPKGKKKKKERKKSTLEEELVNELKAEYLNDITEAVEDVQNKKKSKKLKKVKDEDMNESLPELNMDEILEAAHLNESSNSSTNKHRLCSQDYNDNKLLLSDSELDEIIGTKKIVKIKSEPKTDTEETEEKPKIKKRRHSECTTDETNVKTAKKSKKSKHSLSSSEVVVKEEEPVKHKKKKHKE